MSKSKEIIIVAMLSSIIVLLITMGVLILSLLSPQSNLEEADEINPEPSTIHSTTSIEQLTTLLLTTTIINNLEIQVMPEKFYEGDNATKRIYVGDNILVSITYNDLPIPNMEISLDNVPIGKTNQNGILGVEGIESGDHTLSIEHSEYGTITKTFNAYSTPYGLSRYVRRKLSEEEGEKHIKNGMVNLRFYDLPNCAICRVMRPRVSSLVGEHRNCIVYELISLWKYHDELVGKFTGLQTPIITVESSSYKSSTSGLVSMKRLEDMIERASPGCIS